MNDPLEMAKREKKIKAFADLKAKSEEEAKYAAINKKLDEHHNVIIDWVSRLDDQDGFKLIKGSGRFAILYKNNNSVCSISTQVISIYGKDSDGYDTIEVTDKYISTIAEFSNNKKVEYSIDRCRGLQSFQRAFSKELANYL